MDKFKNLPTGLKVLAGGILFLIIIVVVTGCSSSDNVREKPSDISSSDFTEQLKDVSMLRVEGYKQFADVSARGGKADEPPRYMFPVFVLNGMTLMNNYEGIYDIVNDYTVKNIRLLTGPEAYLYNQSSGRPVVLITAD